MSINKCVKIGIIGLKHSGYYYIQALQRFPNLELIAGCDIDSRQQRLLPGGVIFYNDAHDLLANKNIETVIIATPNKTHYKLGCQVFNAGKNVIMEKPATTSIKEFEKLNLKFEKSSSLHIYYVFHAARALEVTWFKNYYNNNKNRRNLGPVTSFDCNFYDPYCYGGKVKKDALGLQNCWMDSGINALSVISEFVDINSIKSIGFSSASTDNLYTQALAHYSFSIYKNDEAGAGIIDTNWNLGVNFKQTVLTFASSGSKIVLEHSNQKVILIKRNGVRKVLCSFDSKGERLYNHYFEVLKNYLDCYNKKSFDYKRSERLHRLLFQSVAKPFLN